MKGLKKLQSPLALTLEGFLAGALLFLVVDPLGSNVTPASAPAGQSVLADLDA